MQKYGFENQNYSGWKSVIFVPLELFLFSPSHITYIKEEKKEGESKKLRMENQNSNYGRKSYSINHIEPEMDPRGQTVRRTKILSTRYVLKLLILHTGARFSGQNSKVYVRDDFFLVFKNAFL